MEAGQRAEVGDDLCGERDSGRDFGASSEAQMRLKTVPLQVDSVVRYRIFPEALRREANPGRR